MILAIDAVGAKHGGAASVLVAIVGAALGNEAVGRVVVFGSPARMRRFELPAHPRLLEIESPLGEAGPLGRVAWHEFGLARAARQHDAQVVLCLGGGGRGNRQATVVNLVQQSLPFLPEALKLLSARDRLRMAALRGAMGRSCKRASLVVVQTPTMRDAVSRAFAIPSERLAVVEPVPARVEPDTEAPGLESLRSTPPGQRLLYVGNTSAYKNLAILEAALPGIQRAFPEARLFATIPSSHPLARVPGVECLGYLPAPALAQAYRLSTALVMPSFAETVGLPMLEAASAGIPVVAADRPYAHDVCEGAALYFDPLRASALVEAATRLLSSQALQTELANRGRSIVARREASQPYARLIALTLKAGGGDPACAAEGV